MSSTVGISDSSAQKATETLTKSTIMGKEDFLSMLTMQLRYQDPLNPMKNEDFATQLAQFTSLETLQNINTNIQTQIVLGQSMNNSYMMSLIGREVKSYGNTFSLEAGKEASIYFDLPRDATKVKVTVLDENDKAIAVIEPKRTVKAGERAVIWDGMRSDGTKAEAGNYTFKVEASDANGEMTPTTLINGLVTGIGYNEGTPYMIINGEFVSLSDVISVHMASSTTSSSSNNSNSESGSSSTSTTNQSNPQSNQINQEVSRFMSRVLGIE